MSRIKGQPTTNKTRRNLRPSKIITPLKKKRLIFQRTKREIQLATDEHSIRPPSVHEIRSNFAPENELGHVGHCRAFRRSIFVKSSPPVIVSYNNRRDDEAPPYLLLRLIRCDLIYFVFVAKVRCRRANN